MEEWEQNLVGVAEGQIRSADDCQGIDSNKAKAESSFNQLKESGQRCPEEEKPAELLAELSDFPS